MDELTDLGWDISASVAMDPTTFVDFTIYDGQEKLDHSLVYYIPEGKSGTFPVHRYAFIACEDVTGDAPHVCVRGKSEVQIVNTINSIFRKYKEFETAMNGVLLGGGGLEELCRIGSGFLNNPLYIHDNMFCILALPEYVEGMRKFDVDITTGKQYIPLWLINDFKFDEEYQRTLTLQGANLWGNEQYPRDYRCMYVNIWDGKYYMGRLLIEEIRSPFKPGQYAMAEYFALYAKEMMIRDINFSKSDVDVYEALFRNLMNSEQVDRDTVNRLLGTLKWDEGDSYMCGKVISQDSKLAVKSGISLRSKFAELIKSFFCFYYGDQCCLIVNLTKSGMNRGDLEALLAPIVRESYMYAALSNPFRGIGFVPQGFMQVDYVLDALKRDPGKWVNSFNRCVLNYMIEGVNQDLSRSMIIDPGLLDLIEYDRKNNSFLYETLKTYLENERDITKTAELLSVHRTTIIYRLGRLEKYFQMDLEDYNNRLYLLICFKMIDQLGLQK